MRPSHVPSPFVGRALAAGTACALGALLLAREGHAAGAPLELTLHAPIECGSARSIERAVGALVHATPERPLRAWLTVWPLGAEYAAELRTEPAQVRSIRAPSCRAVVEAATVILSLAIDPSMERPPAPRSPGLALDRSERPPPRTVGFLLGASSTIDTAVLPHFAGGASLRAGLVASSWSGTAELTYWLPASTSLDSEPSLGGRFRWWTIGLSGCLAPFARGNPLDGAHDRAPRLSLCLGSELGRLRGEGVGAETIRTAEALWFAAAVGPSLALPLGGKVSARASAGAALTLLGRHPFVLERSGQQVRVHQPARVSARGALGLEMVF